MKIIETKGLSFKYNKNARLVLNDVNLSFDKGSINILLGLNGSGKTTLIKILAGLLEKYNGEVLLDGNNLRNLSIHQRSKKMSYVAQQSGNLNDFLVFDYLLFSRVNMMNVYQMPSSEDRQIVLEYAERFQITHLLDKKLGEISGGERQIIAICGAIIQDTDIVILDEPTSALDIKNQHLVLSTIKNIAEEKNKTFILSSHNPNHALYLDGNVYILKDNRIIKNGPARKIVNIDILREVYGDKIQYSKDLKYNEISFSN